MTVPSQPTDLDKALERVNKRLDAGERVYRGDIEPIMRAAEHSKELAKERDTYFNRLGEHATAIFNLEQQLSTLHAAYKQTLKALKEIKWHDLRDSHVAGDCFVCEHIDKILSTPPPRNRNDERRSMSDTPRTDAVYNKYELHCTSEEVSELHILADTLECENHQLRADLKQCAEALKENRITVSRSGAGHVCVGCGEPFQHPHKDYCLINKALSLPAVQNALKGK